jgi:hypothetical protein
MNPAKLSVAVVALAACATPEPRFPLAEPFTRDTDLNPVWVACHPMPGDNGAAHTSCAPKPTYNPFVWDALDNVLFRPVDEGVSVVDGTGESTDVNSLDEVPDSAWFTNRIGVHPMTPRELELGRCGPEQILDGPSAPDGSWIIDHGKMSGVTDGFRVTVPGKGRFLFKVDDEHQPEHASAAQTVGLRMSHAAGYFVPCEQVVYFRPSVFTLKPHLRYKHDFQDEKDFGQKELDTIFSHSPRRGGLIRMQASAWLPGYILGGFKYYGTRPDDPNDSVPHEDRRELRALRLLNAWLDRTDNRISNTLDAWIVDHQGQPDASPGHVIHNLIDTSEAFGSDYDDEDINRRIGFTYMWDWADIGADFITLGARTNTWDTVQTVPGREMFFYYNVKDFVPERWKTVYPIAAYSRMTERDAAWMARLLARFTPDVVASFARMADYTDPGDTAYLQAVLDGRLEKVLERYLTRLSPIANLHVEGGHEVCGIDLAEWRRLREPAQFRYTARIVGGGSVPVERRAGGELCVALPHVAGVGPDDDGSRYVRVRIEDGVALHPLVVHLYDLGPSRGYRLAGLERPDHG